MPLLRRRLYTAARYILICRQKEQPTYLTERRSASSSNDQRTRRVCGKKIFPTHQSQLSFQPRTASTIFRCRKRILTQHGKCLRHSAFSRPKRRRRRSETEPPLPINREGDFFL